MSKNRRGFALLEVIAATAILAVSGLACVGVAAQALDAVRRSYDTEKEMRIANAFLNAVALWPREDLDSRLGERIQGGWRLYIERRTPTLYAIELRDTLSDHALLTTTVYRPFQAHER